MSFMFAVLLCTSLDLNSCTRAFTAGPYQSYTDCDLALSSLMESSKGQPFYLKGFCFEVLKETNL